MQYLDRAFPNLSYRKRSNEQPQTTIQASQGTTKQPARISTEGNPEWLKRAFDVLDKGGEMSCWWSRCWIDWLAEYGCGPECEGWVEYDEGGVRNEATQE